MSPYQELESLGIPIPPMVPPAAAFIPFVQTGNLLFLSGNIARQDARPGPAARGAHLLHPP